MYNVYTFFGTLCIYVLILLTHPSHALSCFSKIRKIKQSFLLNRRLYMPRRVIAYCHYRPSQVLPQGLFRSHSYIPWPYYSPPVRRSTALRNTGLEVTLLVELLFWVRSCNVFLKTRLSV
jgi:hypothetical protein